MVMFDTDILIGIYRGDIAVKEKVEQLPADVLHISAITVAEFLVWAKDKSDLQKVKNQLDKYIFIPVNADISNIFIGIYNKYVHSHRPGIPDMLIAATSLYYHLPLFLLNKKHF